MAEALGYSLVLDGDGTAGRLPVEILVAEVQAAGIFFPGPDPKVTHSVEAGEAVAGLKAGAFEYL